MSEITKENSVILSIRGLEKSFGDLKVLKGVDLDIKNGEKIANKNPREAKSDGAQGGSTYSDK